jgi:hypothetical protein
MVTQLEDCVDCVKVMYPQFNFVFLFDHSSGHSKKRIGGLNASSIMNKEFGGAQPIMKTSKMEAEDGFLGPFDSILSVGEVQGMQFLPTDSGPFWMTSRKQEDRQHNRTRPDRAPATRREKTKKELAEELSLPGATINPPKQKLEELQEMARKRNISTDKDVQSIQQGWEGKQKGLLQVLWERGWIDESKLDEYKIIKKDDEGIVVDDKSLEVMLASCFDFADDITELQAKGEEMEVIVIPTTKFHAEMAGKGIEYL